MRSKHPGLQPTNPATVRASTVCRTSGSMECEVSTKPSEKHRTTSNKPVLDENALKPVGVPDFMVLLQQWYCIVAYC